MYKGNLIKISAGKIEHKLYTLEQAPKLVTFKDHYLLVRVAGGMYWSGRGEQSYAQPRYVLWLVEPQPDGKVKLLEPLEELKPGRKWRDAVTQLTRRIDDMITENYYQKRLDDLAAQHQEEQEEAARMVDVEAIQASKDAKKEAEETSLSWKLQKHIELFLRQRRASTGGFAPVKPRDLILLNAIIEELIELKWDKDPDGDTPIEHIVIDNTKYEFAHYSPLRHLHRISDDEVELQRYMSAAMRNLSVAMGRLQMAMEFHKDRVNQKP